MILKLFKINKKKYFYKNQIWAQILLVLIILIILNFE